VPLKRRRPKERQVAITPRAIELFNELQRQVYPTDAWFDVHALLHKEVGARPWEYPLHSVNATHMWNALEAAAAAEARQRLETAS
jgi:hypothetical protein